VNGRGRRLVVLAFASVLGAGAVASSASAADQFTLDGKADSYGAIATDAAGNAYVAWNHSASPNDAPTLCRLAPGKRHCTYRVRLSLPGNPETAAALQPFPIVGPKKLVWVVASRYVDDDSLIWTSKNGGKSFGAPHDIPFLTTNTCPHICGLSYSYTGLSRVDDVVPVDFTNFSLYDEGTSRGLLPGSKTPGGIPSFGWVESSVNPGLGFNEDFNDLASAGPPGLSEFEFANPGSGGIVGSSIGVSSFGPTSLSATSDYVETYWRDSHPVRLGYYRYTYTGHPSAGKHPGSASATPQQGAWSGPHSLGVGYEPRMAGGKAGLFLLSEDAPGGTGAARVVHVRRYRATTHTFGPPVTLARNPGSGAYLFVGGGLGENLDTGELAAVWPEFGGSTGDVLRLYLSRGGEHFSPAQDIAASPGFEDAENARVALARNGTGFVTFLDSNGLQIADLYPRGDQYEKLETTTSGRRHVVAVPVTCPAPKGKCKVAISLARVHGDHAVLAAGDFSVAAGATKKLAIDLDETGTELLAAGHGRLVVTLAITLRSPGVTAHELKTRATL
jgi:hypothetical protein